VLGVVAYLRLVSVVFFSVILKSFSGSQKVTAQCCSCSSPADFYSIHIILFYTHFMGESPHPMLGVVKYLQLNLTTNIIILQSFSFRQKPSSAGSCCQILLYTSTYESSAFCFSLSMNVTTLLIYRSVASLW